MRAERGTVIRQAAVFDSSSADGEDVAPRTQRRDRGTLAGLTRPTFQRTDFAKPIELRLGDRVFP
jgi:hypothetical protein